MDRDKLGRFYLNFTRSTYELPEIVGGKVTA